VLTGVAEPKTLLEEVVAASVLTGRVRGARASLGGPVGVGLVGAAGTAARSERQEVLPSPTLGMRRSGRLPPSAEGAGAGRRPLRCQGPS
jgi:hypothetical protein